MAKLKCYFSLRSPYSWLAMKRLADNELGVESQLEYLPFIESSGEVNKRLEAKGGECLYRTMSKEKHLYILGDIKRQAREMGLILKWPVDVDADWSIPHQVFLVIEDAAIKQSFLMQCADERFLRGKNIFDWSICETLLTQWLDESAVARVIEDAKGEKGLSLMTESCYQAYRDGVFGVPFFIVKREKFWGNDRLERFISHSQTMDLI